ncbi:ABC transporter substrate-binding protein [Amycolatopsis pithecellobii]|uniref:ABC transporter substrate-binding protein n=1 Tax=Amycolatopsis pithecellobii TaxID=664692 RepID=UPI001409A09C|nr:ABC transporter substrate-binding protein [Amycolatopsis pithecellobii]
MQALAADAELFERGTWVRAGPGTTRPSPEDPSPIEHTCGMLMLQSGDPVTDKGVIVRLTLRAGAAASAALLAVAALAGCGSSSRDSPAAVGSDGKCTSPATLKTNLVPLYPLVKIGNDAGIFQKHCLVVQDTPAQSPVAAIPAIVGGSQDLTLLPAANLISTLNQKVPLKIVAPGAKIPDDADSLPPAKVDAAGVFLPKGSTIKSPKELEGKSVAVPGLGTSIQFGVMAAVANAGGDPSKIKFVQLDSQTEVQQLRAGKVDAAAIATPFSTQVEKDGYTRIASPTTALYGAGLAHTPWVTSQKALSAKPDAFKRFREAILEVQAYSMAHPDEYYQAMADQSKIPLDAIKAGPGFWFATQMDVNALKAFANKLKSLGIVTQVPELDNVIATS